MWQQRSIVKSASESQRAQKKKKKKKAAYLNIGGHQRRISINGHGMKYQWQKSKMKISIIMAQKRAPHNACAKHQQQHGVKAAANENGMAYGNQQAKISAWHGIENAKAAASP